MGTAALVLSPGGIVAWIIVGLLAGAVAGRLARGSGFGCLGDIVVGLVGALLGGFLLSPFVKETTTEGFLGSLGVAILGSIVLILVMRLLRTAI